MQHSALIPNQVLSLVWHVARILVVAYVAVVAIAYIFQRRLQYFPDTRPVPLPKDDRVRGIEEVTLQAEDGVALKAWYWPGSRPVTLLIFHGNAGSRAHRLDWMWMLHQRGLGVFVLDYRGYGGSSGSPSETGFHLDAVAAWEWLREKTPGLIIAVGESIGAAVAVELATDKAVDGLIIQSAFTSATDVGREAYPWLPVGWLMKDRFENLPKMKDVGCPLLVIHGDRDSIVPISHGERLFTEARPPKQWYPVPGADHNFLIEVGGADYIGRIEAFADSISDSQ